MKKLFIIRITGLVQGVHFRASAKAKAESLNITGIVRNEPDGSVYAEAEGEEANLKKFVDWCYHGPAHAQVKKCVVNEDVLKGYTRFMIER